MQYVNRFFHKICIFIHSDMRKGWKSTEHCPLISSQALSFQPALTQSNPAVYFTVSASLSSLFMVFRQWKNAGNRKISAKIHANGLPKQAAM